MVIPRVEALPGPISGRRATFRPSQWHRTGMESARPRDDLALCSTSINNQRTASEKLLETSRTTISRSGYQSGRSVRAGVWTIEYLFIEAPRKSGTAQWVRYRLTGSARLQTCQIWLSRVLHALFNVHFLSPADWSRDQSNMAEVGPLRAQ